MNCGCDEFVRAHAGAGLPVIEPGMPEPAGTGLTRRSFLLRSAGLALAVYGGSAALRLAGLEDGVAGAAAAKPGTVIVSVFLDGGADGLSMLFPAGDPRYAQLRPVLSLKPQTALPFAEDGRLFWHPSLASIATLYGEGKVSVAPAIGYDHPDQSHVTSRHYW
jgi:uncharacterized protein (DUF1501 family)